MDEKTKKAITSNALERGEVRISLELWQYLPVIDSLCESLKGNSLTRHTMIMALLEEIALEAWKKGRLRGREEQHNESVKPKKSKGT